MVTKILISFFISLFFLVSAQAEIVYTILKGQNLQIQTGQQTRTSCSTILWKGEYLDGSSAQSTISCAYCLAPILTPTKTAIYVFNIPNVITMTVRVIVVNDIKEIVQLKEVYFHDQTDNNQKTNFFPIRRDDNGEYYVNGNQPYWTSNGISHPIAYVSGTKMYVSSKIIIDGTKSLSDKAKIRGTIYIKDIKMADLPTVDYNINKFSTTNMIDYIKVAAKTNLEPNKIIYDEFCKVKWEISFDMGRNWSEFAVSSNELYVLWKKPANEVLLGTFTYDNYEFKHIHSLFHLSCKANDGQLMSNDQNLLNNIWGLFTNNGLGIAPNNLLKRKDNKVLTYYKYFHTVNQSSVSMMRDIDATGQCFAFSFLFIDLQIIQGSNLVSFLNNHKNVTPKYFEPHRTLCGERASFANDNPIRYFLIKHWIFQGIGLDRPNCMDLPYVLLSPTAQLQSQGTRLLVNGDVKKTNNGIEGQNQLEPIAIFPDHSLVAINGQYYDASYGKTYTNDLDFTNRAIDGWVRSPKTRKESDFNLDVNGDGRIDDTVIYSFGSTNQLSTWEISIK
jgi:hypothetical protein